jgi:fumarate reductase subunit D
MKTFLLKSEPVIWLLFGQGILLGTILLTGWVLIVGLAYPMGWVPVEALEYSRAHSLGANVIGRGLLFGLIALPLWKGAHHIRSLSINLWGEKHDAAVGATLYFIAVLGSAVGLLAVIRL